MYILKILVREKQFGNNRFVGVIYRLALDLAGVEYKENSINFSEWPEKKVIGLANGTLPFGQLPLLHMDGLDIVQSTSILRYLSRKY